MSPLSFNIGELDQGKQKLFFNKYITKYGLTVSTQQELYRCV